MSLKTILFLVPIVTTTLFSESTGQQLFLKNCAKCHSTILGVENDNGYDNSYITTAPYIVDLVKKLKKETKSKDEFQTFISQYIQDPDKRKSLYGKRAIKKFGLMPSLKGIMNSEEIKLLTDYLYFEKFNSQKIKEKKSNITEHIDPREKIFFNNCAKCHATVLGVANDGGYDNRYITSAPYVVDVVKKLKDKTKSKDEFINFIREYIQNPDKRKSIYGKRGIKEFGLMPSLKGVMSEEDILGVAEFLYERY